MSDAVPEVDGRQAEAIYDADNTWQLLVLPGGFADPVLTTFPADGLAALTARLGELFAQAQADPRRHGNTRVFVFHGFAVPVQGDPDRYLLAPGGRRISITPPAPAAPADNWLLPRSVRTQVTPGGPG